MSPHHSVTHVSAPRQTRVLPGITFTTFHPMRLPLVDTRILPDETRGVLKITAPCLDTNRTPLDAARTMPALKWTVLLFEK